MVIYETKTKNKIIAVFACLAVVIGLTVLSKMIESNQGIMFRIGSFAFTPSNFLGIIQAANSAMFILMVCFDYKLGKRLALIVMSINLVFMIMGVIKSGNMNAIPGIFNSVISAVCVLIISNELNKSEKRAVTDYLSGLRNRRGLTALLEAKVKDKKPFHVVYFEIDNFRTINDNLGHKYGDIAIKSVAKHLGQIEDENDVFVSRIGGAEFAAVLFGNIKPELFAEKVIEKIGTSITNADEGFQINIALSVYAGIASFPNDADNTDDLLKYADIAVFNARLGKSKVAFFDQDMKDKFQRQIELEKIVKESLQNDYFYLVYQPQYEIKEKKLRGFETLLRLKKPDGTEVYPGEFIPVVEQSDLIMKIDSYVLKRGMKEAKKFIDSRGKDITVSINVSAKNISSPGFVMEVKSVLESCDFPPECLEIEITEYSFAQSQEITSKNITELRNMGVQVALDDFGTGYTSLARVMKLPFSLLKIDKSLIDDIESNSVNQDFVDTIIYMGHLMHCEVISEGVESTEQLAFLADHECNFVQGYVWGRPMEYSKAIELCNVKSM